MRRLRIDPSQYNDDSSEENLMITEARNKLFKVKRIENRNLYGDENTRGEHLVLTVGINPRNNVVATTTITSLEDAERNPTKQGQLNRGLIMELPEDKISNFSRKVGIQQTVITQNMATGNNINYSMLREPLYGATVDEALIDEVDSFLFDNPRHRRRSNINNARVRGYEKIK
ncbi:MAG: hypothetical protein NC310_05610 [Roseburia sp.]|nr:hypothetical protein [Anaeroplasma bactoclasticum]MCM1196536.1 hypothetical protein [Roseburia sp.]MCM1557761.1 hypothetical protein [Anaeroplasma bactoclasticum]